jgi:hypothetical protein
MSKITKSVMIPDELLMNKIYLTTEQKVMPDRDLAELYGVEKRAFNQAVKRNSERFPKDFMFTLNRKEWDTENIQNICLMYLVNKALL